MAKSFWRHHPDDFAFALIAIGNNPSFNPRYGDNFEDCCCPDEGPCPEFCLAGLCVKKGSDDFRDLSGNYQKIGTVNGKDAFEFDSGEDEAVVRVIYDGETSVGGKIITWKIVLFDKPNETILDVLLYRTKDCPCPFDPECIGEEAAPNQAYEFGFWEDAQNTVPESIAETIAEGAQNDAGNVDVKGRPIITLQRDEISDVADCNPRCESKMGADWTQCVTPASTPGDGYNHGGEGYFTYHWQIGGPNGPPEIGTYSIRMHGDLVKTEVYKHTLCEGTADRYYANDVYGGERLNLGPDPTVPGTEGFYNSYLFNFELGSEPPASETQAVKAYLFNFEKNDGSSETEPTQSNHIIPIENCDDGTDFDNENPDFCITPNAITSTGQHYTEGPDGDNDFLPLYEWTLGINQTLILAADGFGADLDCSIDKVAFQEYRFEVTEEDAANTLPFVTIIIKALPGAKWWMDTICPCGMSESGAPGFANTFPPLDNSPWFKQQLAPPKTRPTQDPTVQTEDPRFFDNNNLYFYPPNSLHQYANECDTDGNNVPGRNCCCIITVTGVPIKETEGPSDSGGASFTRFGDKLDANQQIDYNGTYIAHGWHDGAPVYIKNSNILTNGNHSDGTPRRLWYRLYYRSNPPGEVGTPDDKENNEFGQWYFDIYEAFESDGTPGIGGFMNGDWAGDYSSDCSGTREDGHELSGYRGSLVRPEDSTERYVEWTHFYLPEDRASTSDSQPQCPSDMQERYGTPEQTTWTGFGPWLQDNGAPLLGVEINIECCHKELTGSEHTAFDQDNIRNIKPKYICTSGFPIILSPPIQELGPQTFERINDTTYRLVNSPYPANIIVEFVKEAPLDCQGNATANVTWWYKVKNTNFPAAFQTIIAMPGLCACHDGISHAATHESPVGLLFHTDAGKDLMINCTSMPKENFYLYADGTTKRCTVVTTNLSKLDIDGNGVAENTNEACDCCPELWHTYTQETKSSVSGDDCCNDSVTNQEAGSYTPDPPGSTPDPPGSTPDPPSYNEYPNVSTQDDEPPLSINGYSPVFLANVTAQSETENNDTTNDAGPVKPLTILGNTFFMPGFGSNKVEGIHFFNGTHDPTQNPSYDPGTPTTPADEEAIIILSWGKDYSSDEFPEVAIKFKNESVNSYCAESPHTTVTSTSVDDGVQKKHTLVSTNTGNVASQIDFNVFNDTIENRFARHIVKVPTDSANDSACLFAYSDIPEGSNKNYTITVKYRGFTKILETTGSATISDFDADFFENPSVVDPDTLETLTCDWPTEKAKIGCIFFFKDKQLDGSYFGFNEYPTGAEVYYKEPPSGGYATTPQTYQQQTGKSVIENPQNLSPKYTTDEINYFKQNHFGADYGTTGNVLSKYEYGERVYVRWAVLDNDGNSLSKPSADLDIIQEAVSEINQILDGFTTTSLAVSGNLPAPDRTLDYINLFFTTPERFLIVNKKGLPPNNTDGGYAPENGVFQQSYDSSGGSVDTFTNLWFNNQHEIYSAQIFINDQRSGENRKCDIMKTIFAAMGFVQSPSTIFPDSIRNPSCCNGSSPVRQYSDLDKKILQMLYTSGVEYGMTAQEAGQILSALKE